jgi:hypothetical protein
MPGPAPKDQAPGLTVGRVRRYSEYSQSICFIATLLKHPPQLGQNISCGVLVGGVVRDKKITPFT